MRKCHGARLVACAAVTVFTTGVAVGVPAAARTPLAPAQTQAQNGRLVFEGWGACFDESSCFSSTAPTSDIWSVNPDGTGLTNLTNAPGVDATPQWSPEGSKIVFESNRNGHYDIFVVDGDGSDLQQLTEDRGDEHSATWSPSGGRIAYVDNSRRQDAIVVMGADGGHSRRITALPELGDLAWSPDGRHIAFTRVIRDDPTRSSSSKDRFDVFVVRPDGTGLRLLTSRYGSIESSNPNWAPDGRHIVFAGSRCEDGVDRATCDRWSIFTIRRDGRSLRRIASTGSWVEAPEWSPDGTTIVYTSDEGDPANYGDLWFVDPDGSNQRQAVVKPDTYDYEVDWQPLP